MISITGPIKKVELCFQRQRLGVSIDGAEDYRGLVNLTSDYYLGIY